MARYQEKSRRQSKKCYVALQQEAWSAIDKLMKRQPGLTISGAIHHFVRLGAGLPALPFPSVTTTTTNTQKNGN
jgi:hypothetical protein